MSITYYIEQNGQILLYDTDKTLFMNSYNDNPDFAGLEIKETERPIVDFQFADTEEYKQEQVNRAQLLRIDAIKSQLKEIDIKRIRAICEPCEYSQGITWLDYYNNQVQALRLELQKLEGTSSNDNHSNK